eukprot:757269-Rhodomonas_salina.3
MARSMVVPMEVRADGSTAMGVCGVTAEHAICDCPRSDIALSSSRLYDNGSSDLLISYKWQRKC